MELHRISVALEKGVWAALDARARRMRRSVSSEAALAVEAWVSVEGERGESATAVEGERLLDAAQSAAEPVVETERRTTPRSASSEPESVESAGGVEGARGESAAQVSSDAENGQTGQEVGLTADSTVDGRSPLASFLEKRLSS
jgi:hypothetical protein